MYITKQHGMENNCTALIGKFRFCQTTIIGWGNRDVIAWNNILFLLVLAIKVSDYYNIFSYFFLNFLSTIFLYKSLYKTDMKVSQKKFECETMHRRWIRWCKIWAFARCTTLSATVHLYPETFFFSLISKRLKHPCLYAVNK